jgi:KDO2-lipid IV(A) lauroyltransferase
MERVGPGAIRALRRGEILALLIDTPALGNGVTVDFFGAPCEVPTGPARIALHTGARVIPAALVRIKGHDHLIQPVLDFELRYDKTDDEKADVRNLTQKIMRSLEQMVRQYPDQWFIFRPMWPAPLAVREAEPLLVAKP